MRIVRIWAHFAQLCTNSGQIRTYLYECRPNSHNSHCEWPHSKGMLSAIHKGYKMGQSQGHLTQGKRRGSQTTRGQVTEHRGTTPYVTSGDSAPPPRNHSKWSGHRAWWGCVCGGRGGGENNIKQGGPHGSGAPSDRLRRQLEKDGKLQSWRAMELSLVPARVAVGGFT